MRRAIIISILFGLLAVLPSTGLARTGKWDRNGVYATRVSVLKQTISQHPNDDALDYIVDTLRNTRTYDKMRTYKAILDRWEGADSTAGHRKVKTSRPEAIRGCGTVI